MEFDYSKLRGRIVEICGNMKTFADLMGLSQKTISLKVCGKIYWTQKEMMRSAAILKFDFSDIPLYFFAPKVQ